MSIVINDVSKKINNIDILKNIDISIKSGVFGIIGYNSSGKSTLIKIITSLIEPTSGSIKLFGDDIKSKKKEAMSRSIGYLPQNFSFYENYTIEDFMNYMANIHGIKKSSRQNRIEEVLRDLLLYEKRLLKFNMLTEGMKRRVGLAQAMLNKPEILIVDDPIINMEKYEKRLIKELLNKYGKNNIVILSTRNASDLEGIASNVAVMHKGQICFNGSSESLIRNASESVWISNIGEFLDMSRLKGIHKVVSFDKMGKDYYARVISDVRPDKESISVKATFEDAFLYSIYNS